MVRSGARMRAWDMARKKGTGEKDIRNREQMMFGLIEILLFFIIAVLIAYLWKESLADTLPMTACMLVLTLYGLAFFHKMSLIGILLPVSAILLSVVAVVKNAQKDAAEAANRKERDERLKEDLLSPALWTYILLTILILIGVTSKVVTWWDDYNFWATDLKSIYALNGFASKYTNVAPEFGDYPPGTQMFKWWILSLAGKGFQEGIAFAGYHLFLFLFALPILKPLGKKQLCLVPLLAPCLWLFPGIGEVYGYRGFCADLVMAFLYGAALYHILDREDHTGLFYYARIGLELSVLVLCKSTGFLWAGFAILFLAGSEICRKQKKWLAPILTAVIPIGVGGSWMLFCLRMHRVTKTTSTAVTYLTTDTYGVSAYTSDFAKAFLKAFFTEPLHRFRTGILDLPPFFMLVLLILLLVLFYKRGLLPKREGLFSCIYLVAAGLLYYGIIFLAHITVFANETQYLESAAMVASIERYGAPFVLGTALCLAGRWLRGGSEGAKEGSEGKKESSEGTEETSGGTDKISSLAKLRSFCTADLTGRTLAFLIAILLMADFGSAWDGIWGYRNGVAAELELRESMHREEEEALCEMLAEHGMEGTGCRIYVITPVTTNYNVRNTYLNYLVSPVSLTYSFYDMTEVPTDLLVQQIGASHAEYVYAYPFPEQKTGNLSELTQGEEFLCETLYKIRYEGGAMILDPL